MAAYSIRDLEILTGVKAHTIRIWEKRYHIVEPLRTVTNIRYYSDKDLKKLLNISLLNKHGLKISSIASLKKEEIKNKIIEFTYNQLDADSQIDNLIIEMMDLNEMKFDNIISNCIQNLGFEQTVIKILFPFLIRIGVLWQTESIIPAQEHFISNIIRQKLIVAIHDLPINALNINKKFILFLPEGELHELGLLFYYYLVKKRGFHVLYLGQSLPFNDLIEVSRTYEPGYFITCFTSPLPQDEFNAYLTQLSETFSTQQIFISGPQILMNNFPISRNIVNFSSITSLKQELEIIRDN